jgi:hypothetical protein
VKYFARISLHHPLEIEVCQGDQGGHVNLHHGQIPGKCPLVEFSMPAKTGIVDQDIDLQTGLLGGRKDLVG